jgi:hypothetical protein
MNKEQLKDELIKSLEENRELKEMNKDEIANFPEAFEKLPLPENDLKKMDLMTIAGITRFEVNFDNIKVETRNEDVLVFKNPGWLFQKKIIKNLIKIVDERYEGE